MTSIRECLMHEAEAACYYGYVFDSAIASNLAVIVDALVHVGVSASAAAVGTSAATSRLTVDYTSAVIVAVATRTTIVFEIMPSSRLEPMSKH